jgi:anti-sigma B factor antagonist
VTLVADRSVQVSRSPLGQLEVHARPDRDVVHLESTGELDMATAPFVRRQVDELVAAGFTHLVIDLRGLAFMDCAGIHLLLGLDAAARGDGWRLSIVQGHDAIERLFALTHTLESLPFASGDGFRARPR